jgi:hypothetical protein
VDLSLVRNGCYISIHHIINHDILDNVYLHIYLKRVISFNLITTPSCHPIQRHSERQEEAQAGLRYGEAVGDLGWVTQVTSRQIVVLRFKGGIKGITVEDLTHSRD